LRLLRGWMAEKQDPETDLFSPPFSSHLKTWWAITAERPFFRCGGVRSRYPC
jgi:hypothetical protein